jgi:hypothetical protein
MWKNSKGAMCAYCGETTEKRFGDRSKLTVSMGDMHYFGKACKKYIEINFQWLEYLHKIQLAFSLEVPAPPKDLFGGVDRHAKDIKVMKSCNKNMGFCRGHDVVWTKYFTVDGIIRPDDKAMDWQSGVLDGLIGQFGSRRRLAPGKAHNLEKLQEAHSEAQGIEPHDLEKKIVPKLKGKRTKPKFKSPAEYKPLLVCGENQKIDYKVQVDIFVADILIEFDTRMKPKLDLTK